jgi:hypothetical protein
MLTGNEVNPLSKRIETDAKLPVMLTRILESAFNVSFNP